MRTIKAELVDLLIEYAADDYTDEQYRVIEGIVEDAIEEVRNARYPFGYASENELRAQDKEVLSRFKSNVRRIAQYHYDKIGDLPHTGLLSYHHILEGLCPICNT